MNGEKRRIQNIVLFRYIKNKIAKKSEKVQRTHRIVSPLAYKKNSSSSSYQIPDYIFRSPVSFAPKENGTELGIGKTSTEAKRKRLARKNVRTIML